MFTPIKKTLEINLTFRSDCSEADLNDHIREVLARLDRDIKENLNSSLNKKVYVDYDKSYKVRIDTSINEKETQLKASFDKLLNLLDAKDLKSAIDEIESLRGCQNFCNQYR